MLLAYTGLTFKITKKNLLLLASFLLEPLLEITEGHSVYIRLICHNISDSKHIFILILYP